MAEDKKNQHLVLETRDIPTIYVNHANVTVSFNDFRVYISEASPKSITPLSAVVPSEAEITPRASLVMSPEFGKALCDALKISVEKYEGLFGQLRKKPEKETLKTIKMKAIKQ